MCNNKGNMSTSEENRQTKKHKRYDKEFKRQAVEMWVKSGKRAEEIAEELGVQSWDLYKWKRVFQPSLPVGGEGSEPPTVEDLQGKLARMERELERVKTQRDILKKTLGIVCEVPGSGTSGSKS